MEERGQQAADHSAHSADDRLDSWKRIAAYLDRTVRTVRRWEHDEGLPIHRHLHKKLGTVYAYKSEIDTWRQTREPVADARLEQFGANTGVPTRRLVGLLVLGLLVLVAGILISRPSSQPNTGVPGRLMLAVLPFENLSGDPEQEYFSDGFTEEMITELGNLDPERLGVIARTSVMQYKHTGKSIAQIGRELGVNYVLDGSVRRAGERVRINAQLIRVNDRTHLWAEGYEHPLSDILSMQLAVARRVADAIELTLAPPEQASSAGRSASTQAYEAFLKGRHFWAKRTPEGLLKAREHLEHAVAADPRFALAQANLAGVYSMMSYYGVLPPREAYLRAEEAALRAIELAPRLAPAHAVLATVRERWHWDWSGAETAFRRALELDPNYATGYHWYGLFLERMGRLDEARVVMDQALRLDPVSLIINKNVADPYFYAGEYDHAIKQYRLALELDPDFGNALLFLGYAFEQHHRSAEAIAAFERAHEADEQPAALAALGHLFARAGNADQTRRILAELERMDAYVDPYHLAVIHVGLGEADPAFEWLEQAFETRSEWLLHIKVDPRLDPIRADSRFDAFLRRMNLG